MIIIPVPLREIPDNLRQFIFEHIDSVGQIDVLFFLREAPETYFNAETISRELRTNANSASKCIMLLLRSQLLVEHESTKGEYRYAPRTAELEEVVNTLAAVYKIKPHKILELIFSSAKRARQFADAFSISKISKPEDENG